ncbi:threonine-phosphate decarboxylase [Synechococcus sp. MU1617]|uniref:threonine-phosphate decarboxylase n=1 Tax=Synechococcus sp. MU1617 TaxID=2508346 RepID=UPI001CF926A3|nr:threonine-phosphate decarboxylase [Synechococcus sp. MU1617]MCB4389112.1 aminotransferase class I/II-fold pyridoxal phosphate-dependent enzyme [Synechococcus sp. MU1617]
MGVDLRHGGNRQAVADVLGCRPSQLLDASASLAPWTPRCPRFSEASLRDYPDRNQRSLRQAIAAIHGLPLDCVLPGNGAAELFTWAARDAAAVGLSGLLAPGFADYRRALQCWGAALAEKPLALSWDHAGPLTHPPLEGSVAWICNPHNPTGQLWSLASLEAMLDRHALVICDEAFLPLVPEAEHQSMIPLVAHHPNLVVIRSLTKLFGVAGLRVGYAIAQPDRLKRWQAWRDPWPVNGIAAALIEQWLGRPGRYKCWCSRVQRWTASQGAWMQRELTRVSGITPMPSAANFLLISGRHSLLPLREALEHDHRILLRDCRSFAGLGETWLRIGLQAPRDNRRIVRALKQVQRIIC